MLETKVKNVKTAAVYQHTRKQNCWNIKQREKCICYICETCCNL